jgi:UDP-glucuronate decarboxylase
MDIVPGARVRKGSESQQTGLAIVAGGAGFLGSLVCERLIAEGRQVVCIDDLSTGRAANIEPLARHSRFKFIEGDVRAFSWDAPAEEIWNFACPASPLHYQLDPVQTMLVNVVGMHRLLELARKNGSKVFQASTSEVYGDPDIHPQPETYLGAVNPAGPRACYDEGKRAAETLCFDYARKHDVDVRVARIFNTYGPNMAPDDGRVVSNFIISALANEPLVVYGDGSQTRSFCYRDDLVDGLFRMMRHPRRINGPINLGNPTETTISALAELIIQATKSRSTTTYFALPVDDPKRRRPDISLARGTLGWAPVVTLKDGLNKTIDYFKVGRQAA